MIPLFQRNTERGNNVRFKTWLHTHRPEVIIHPSTVTPFLTQLLAQKNIRCLAYDAARPDEPGIVPDYREVGRRAVEQLVNLMQTNQLGLPAAAACTYVAVNLPAQESPTGGSAFRREPGAESAFGRKVDHGFVA